MLGYVVSMYNARRTGHRLYVETMRAGHGAAVFTAMIPHAADFADAIGTLRPVTLYKPKGAAARAIHALRIEVLERLDAASAVGAGEAA
jgi:chromosome partitioning protein